MSLKIRTLAGGFALLVTEATAQTEGSGLLSVCQESGFPVCQAIVMAHLDAVDYGVSYTAMNTTTNIDQFNEISGVMMPYCPPAGTSKSDVTIAVFNYFIENNITDIGSQTKHIIQAMSRSFPCE